MTTHETNINDVTMAWTEGNAYYLACSCGLVFRGFDSSECTRQFEEHVRLAS